jgi:hypothetical protein
VADDDEDDALATDEPDDAARGAPHSLSHYHPLGPETVDLQEYIEHEQAMTDIALQRQEAELQHTLRVQEAEILHERAMARMAMQHHAVRFLFWAYGGLLAATIGIILLQGFRAWGFALDLGFLRWLGAATVGEVAGLAALVYGSLFSVPPAATHEREPEG